MKKKVAIVFVALLFLSWYVSVDAYFGLPKKFEDHIKKAEAFEAKEIFEDAIVEYEQAQECLRKKDIQLDMKIAAGYLAMNEKNKYENKMEEIIATYEINELAVKELTDYYVEKGKISKAVKVLLEEYNKQPENKMISEALNELKGSYTNIYTNYNEMSKIQNGYSSVCNADGWGVVDSNGTAIISSTYDQVGIFGEKSAVVPVCKAGKWFYINAKEHKKLVPDKAYEYLGFFSEGRALACLNGKYGYLNEEMEEQCVFEYEQASQFFNHVAAVKKGDKWAIIDDEFQQITDFIYEEIAMDEFGFCSVGDRIFVKKDGTYKMVDLKGNYISEETYDDAYPFENKDEYAAVKKGNKWGFVTSEGELCIEYQYDNAKSFSIGFAAVEEMGVWGYIDTDNRLVIPCQFDSVTEFYEDGTAAVKNDDKWYMIKLNIYQ